MQNYLKGSEWRKWDLHLHSPNTFMANEYNSCTTDEFIQAILKAELSVVGLTNYFRFNEDDLKIIKEQLESHNVTVFPNIEFRTQPPNKENDEMNIHVIFSNKTPISKIDGFLGRLLTVDNKYCSSLDQTAIETTSIQYQLLIKTLVDDKELKHLEDYIVVACPRGYGNFRPLIGDGRGNKFAIVVDQETDLMFGNADDVSHFLNEDRYTNAVQKPVLLCSDAHDLESIGKKSTWVKADTTFEGLKQTLWEPAERVRIQERNPGDTKTSRITIEKLRYTNANGQAMTVHLNDDLNSIIGTRGSGKSTLLKNIAYHVDPNQFNAKDNVKRLYKLKDFEAIWSDNKKNSGTDESPKSVFYIPQNYLSSLAYEESGRATERDAFLTSLLKKSTRFANAIKTYDDFSSDNKVKLEGLIQLLLGANQTLDEAIKQTRKLGAKKEIEQEINFKNEEIKKYNSFGTNILLEEEIKNYSDAKLIISNATSTLVILNQDKEILANILKEETEIFISNQDLSRLSVKRQFELRTEFTKKSKADLEQLINNEINKIVSEIKIISDDLKVKQGIVNGLDEKINTNKAVATLSKESGDLHQVLKTINELEAIINQSVTDKEKALNELTLLYAGYEIQQTVIFKSIEFENEFTFLEIDIVSYYNLDNLKTFIEKNINTMATSPILTNDDDDIKKLFGENPEIPLPVTIRKFINKLISGEIKLKVDAGELNEVVSSLLKDRYEIDYLNSVKTKKEGILFKNMTGGQKAIGMLELVFRFDNEKYPILIDQPEDDLDVNGIATDLVKFIKEEKNERQIIIVSHNGSLVVCADSEEVIVSKSEKIDGLYNFEYTTGSIENVEIREQIIQVLEGGRSALKQRARKLDFKYAL